MTRNERIAVFDMLAAALAAALAGYQIAAGDLPDALTYALVAPLLAIEALERVL